MALVKYRLSYTTPYFLTAACGAAAAILIGRLVWSGMHSPGLPDFATYYHIPRITFEDNRIPYNNFAPLNPLFYPPASIPFLALLSLLPYSTAQAGWALLSLTALLTALYLLKRLLTFPWWFYFLVLGLMSQMYPVRFTFSDGQINFFLLFFVVGGYYFWRERKDFWAGLCLALGVIFKISPVLLLVYFLWRRQWRVFLYGVLFVTLFSGMAELLLPKEGVGSINWYYFRRVVDDISKQGGPSYRDQSVLAWLLRWERIHGWVEGTVMPLVAGFKLLDIRRLLNLVSFGMVGLVAMVVGWLSRKPLLDRKSQRALVDYSILLVVGVIGTGLAWFHQYILLLFPLLVVAVWAEKFSRGWWRIVVLAGSMMIYGVWAINLELPKYHPFLRELDAQFPMLVPMLLYGAISLVVILFALRPVVSEAPPAGGEVQESFLEEL